MKPTPDQIVTAITSAITNITAEWSLSADVTPDTKLIGELGFTSMDVIDLFAMLDVALQAKLPYERFVVPAGDGEYRQEMSVAEIAAFVDEYFDRPRGGPQPV